MNSIFFEKSLMIYECCRVIKGHTKSIIYDLQRSNNRFIPNDLANILLKNNGKKIKEILTIYPTEHHDVLLENISLLIDEEYLFFTDTPERFPSLSLQWDEPSEISNAIIEYGAWMKSVHVDRIFDQFVSLGCQHVELRVYDILTTQELLSSIASIQQVGFISIDVFANCPTGFNFEAIKLFIANNIHLRKLTIFNCKASETYTLGKSGFGLLMLTPKSLDERIHCGSVAQINFAVNIKFFTESIAHGNCLNRKISIDKDGHIKNCPSMPESFGHVVETGLEEAIIEPGFKKYWNINKNFIDICKDCEFRYMCHDCRAYVEDPHGTSGPKDTNLSKPLKCGYDPYKGEWEEWSDNPLKQKAIDFYGMRDMVTKEMPSK